MTTITISVPDLSGAADVDVIEVMVKAGDVISEGDSLIAVETDKAAMEVPAPQSGTVVEVIMQEGTTCNPGDAILTISAASESAVTSVAETAMSEVAVSKAPSQAAVSPPPAANETAATTIEEIKVPDLSGAADVDVIEVMVAVGDSVTQGDSLIAVETDKASMEVPSPTTGVVKSIAMQEGATCNVGDLILSLEVTSGAAAVSAPPISEPSISPASQVESVAPAPIEPTQVIGAVSNSTEAVNVPDLSGAENVDVIEVMVSVGDSVTEGDSLIAVETDKASMEVPSPKTGVVKSIAMQEGSTCNVGDLILSLEVSSQQAAAPASVAPTAAPIAPVSTAAKTSVTQTASVADTKTALSKKNQTTLYAGPAVRILAREFGVDLTQVKGTGRRARILKEDVQAFVKEMLKKATSAPAPTATSALSGTGIPQVPEIDFSQFGEIELEKLSKIARLTRDNMSRSWLNVPHVTQFDEADITDLEVFRKEMKDEAAKSGVRLTPMPFIIKAVVKALQENPRFNASLHADGQHLVLKKYINIGIAVDTPNGLMVPVIKNADQKSIYQLATEAVELAGKAKARKLTVNEMQGACFTISSLGGIGGTGFTPIVNTPEVAILGVSKADIKPRWNGKEFEPRKMLPLCLSYDHRAINGSDGGRFMTYLNAVLSDIRRLVL
ncbi:MAG: pyruvate dehydrogenase complex dihydrolipoyllysine-residue acetyltransferase [Oceanospirillaceae bacterium]